jgi:hypothetical protein
MHENTWLYPGPSPNHRRGLCVAWYKASFAYNKTSIIYLLSLLFFLDIMFFTLLVVSKETYVSKQRSFRFFQGLVMASVGSLSRENTYKFNIFSCIYVMKRSKPPKPHDIFI